MKKSIFYIALSLWASQEGKAVTATFTLPSSSSLNASLVLSEGLAGTGNTVIQTAINWLNTQKHKTPMAGIDLTFNAFANIPTPSANSFVKTEYTAYQNLASALLDFPSIKSVTADLSLINKDQYDGFMQNWLTNYVSGTTTNNTVNVTATTQGDLWTNGTFSSLCAASSPKTTLNFTNCVVSQLAPFAPSGVFSSFFRRCYVAGANPPVRTDSATLDTNPVSTSNYLRSGLNVNANVNFTDCLLGSNLIAYNISMDGTVPNAIGNVLGNSSVYAGNKIVVTYNNWLGHVQTIDSTNKNLKTNGLLALNPIGMTSAAAINYTSSNVTSDTSSDALISWTSLGFTCTQHASSTTSPIILTLDGSTTPTTRVGALTATIPASGGLSSPQNTQLLANLAQDPLNPDLLMEARRKKVELPELKGELTIAADKLSSALVALKERGVTPQRTIVTHEKLAYNADAKELYVPLKTLVSQWSDFTEIPAGTLQEGLKLSSDQVLSSIDANSRVNFLTSLKESGIVNLMRVETPAATEVSVKNGKITVKITDEETLNLGEKGKKAFIMP